MAEQQGTDWPDSLWCATAPTAPDCPALQDTAEADVAIVGGGFTGLSAALHLAEAGRHVRLLEAEAPGWGASGRNGGQVNPGWKILPDEILARYGAARGQRVVAMASRTCDLVFDLIARHDIACDAVRPGYVQGGFGTAGLEKLANWTDQWSRQGAEVTRLDRQEAAELLGTTAYHGAFLDKRGGNIQPLAYARGLARAAQAAGAVLHGRSPATAIEPDGAGWRVATPEGTLKAQQVLLGTNGYTAGLWPGLKQTVVPVPSFILASEPLGDNFTKSILPGRHAVSETRHVQAYYRWAQDGRFVFGGRGNLWDVSLAGDCSHLEEMAASLFPQLASVRWDYRWSGYVAMTPDQTPKLWNLAPGVHAGLGFNGRGVAMSTMMGKQLANLALGEDPDMPVAPMRRIPFHAARQIGISWNLVAGALRDRWEARAG